MPYLSIRIKIRFVPFTIVYIKKQKEMKGGVVGFFGLVGAMYIGLYSMDSFFHSSFDKRAAKVSFQLMH